MVRSFEQHGYVIPQQSTIRSSNERYLWIANDIIMSRQKGVFRVNCIDCLDRTNVVQVCSPGPQVNISNFLSLLLHGTS